MKRKSNVFKSVRGLVCKVANFVTTKVSTATSKISETVKGVFTAITLLVVKEDNESLAETEGESDRCK